MGRFTRWLMLVLILSFGISPASARPAQGSPAWEPGFYTG